MEVKSYHHMFAKLNEKSSKLKTASIKTLFKYATNNRESCKQKQELFEAEICIN